jgi:serine/threonine-protein kinase SRPK3
VGPTLQRLARQVRKHGTLIAMGWFESLRSCDIFRRYRRHPQQYVAVKILTAHATQVQRRLADELSLLQHVRDLAGKSKHPGRAHVIALIDSFEVSSIQGNHLCLVHEATGTFPKMDRLGLPIPLVKLVTKQLLLALDFLHRECHVVHTGAFSANVFQIPA